MAAGGGQVGHVGVEVLAATGAVVLGVEHHDLAWPPCERISQIMKGAAGQPIAIGAVTAVWTRSPPVVLAADADLGLGQILGTFDPHSGIGAIFAGSWHGETPGRKVLPGNTLDDGKVFTELARFLCYRLLRVAPERQAQPPAAAEETTPRAEPDCRRRSAAAPGSASGLRISIRLTRPPTNR